MSPSPMAPSSASVRACRATSASEWPCERMRVGDADAAQPDVVAGHEPVHVEALPGTHVGRLGAGSALGHGEVLRGGELDVGMRCPEREPRAGPPIPPPRHRRSGRRGRRPARARARPGCRRSGSLAGSAPATAPRDRAWRRRGCRAPACLSVSARGTAATAPGDWPSAASTRSMMSGVTNGRAASWISTRSGACGASAAGRCGRRPAAWRRRRWERAACRCVASACDRGRVERLVAGRDHHLHHVDGGVIQEHAERARENRDAPDARVLLGQRTGGPRAAAGSDDQRGSLQATRLPGSERCDNRALP